MRNSEKIPTKKNFLRPKEFMRARHPDLFSDTLSLTEPLLTKSIIEYHLDTLTSRKQELNFEEFCRRLIELEICPNIKPQTGPIGGGDSKVDASTYPVAPSLTERCYWGSPDPPSDETWGFAFSCKKRWKEKVKEDVKNIASLERKFTKVFFITNQFTRDKTRTQVELELSNKFGFEVHILDRAWIVNKIIENKREDLAIETLGIQVSYAEKPQLGPLDASRQREFDTLLKRLSQPELYFGNDFVLAQDYLKAAKLARSLEKPRHEVDGLFSKARTLAEKVGNKGQIIRCGYHHAWTTYWWFEDLSSFERIYSETEGYLPGTVDAEDCELVHNLWMLLYGEITKGKITQDRARLNERLSNIKKELDRLAREKNRPNNALYAETLLSFTDLIEGINDESKVKQAFTQLKNCLSKSIDLGTYPLMKLINRFSEMGEVFGGLPGYDSFFAEMVSIARDRLSETSEGELLFIRGMQLLDMNNLKDGLRCLGQARVKLAKRETLEKSIHASLGCSIAYMAMGLHWAARMEALTSAHASMITEDASFEFPLECFFASKLMGWLELRLGRIASFIAWHRFSWFLLNYIKSQGYNAEKLEEELMIQDEVLGCFFLNLDHKVVKEFDGLQNGLERANLFMSKLALLYALGDIDNVVKELPKELTENKEKIDDYFSKWKDQPASEQMPDNLTEETHSYRKFETTLMGVKYYIITRNQFGPMAFAENLLGIIEAALALAKWENLAFIVDKVNFVVDIDESGNNPPSLELDRPPDPDGYYMIWKPDMLEWLRKTNPKEIKDYFMQLLLKLLADTTIDPLEDLSQELERWHKEDTFSRAIGMSPTCLALLDIIGEEDHELRYWYKASTTS